jgi:2-oxoglutarate dehydrogenase E2 component (dihydrolipoamide succinyltransferase)
MARIEVVMPQMGESIAEGTIVKWHKKQGENVAMDETLLEITTDKVDSEIPSPASGMLSEIMAEENTTVAVQAVIAVIETESSAASGPPVDAPGPVSSSVTAANVVTSTGPISSAGQGPPPSHAKLTTSASPQTPPQTLPSPQSQPRRGTPQRQAPPRLSDDKADAAVSEADPSDLRKKYPAPLYDVVPMTSMMQRMAAHMVKSISTSPHVAAHHEADMTAVVNHRTENLSSFEAKEGFKLTYTPYIIEAVIEALHKYPLVNSSVEGTTIIRKNFINLGIAVAAENGLIVPVIKNAEEKNFLGIARAVNDLVTRTRKKKLSPEDVQGGTFTITNYGIFGTTIGTPIINQPQVAILGTGAIRPRVAVVNNAMAIRSIAYFTLSFDHRIIDGELGGRFLEAVIGHLQQFDTTRQF